MEIFNYSAEVANNNGYSHGEYALALRLMNHRIRCIAADDNHDGYDCEADSCGGWVVFKAPELSYEAIIKAYDDMRFLFQHRSMRLTVLYEDGVSCWIAPLSARALNDTGDRPCLLWLFAGERALRI